MMRNIRTQRHLYFNIIERTPSWIVTSYEGRTGVGYYRTGINRYSCFREEVLLLHQVGAFFFSRPFSQWGILAAAQCLY